MSFEQRLSAIGTWQSLVYAMGAAVTESEGDPERLKYMVGRIVMRGLFSIEIRLLAAELGVALTETETSQSALAMRLRCLLALGRDEDAARLSPRVVRNPKVVEAMKVVSMRLAAGERVDADARDRLVEAIIESEE